ncbi:hypothetical protein L4C34_17710 [Vibrio profundum]|uniref:hypothetical protein n=1 Tax=Vibrio profundum TaxID=2910247 RepID=UPI003D12D9BC
MNLKWIKPLIDIEDNSPLSEPEVIDFVGRISKKPKAFVARYCVKLDDVYQLEPETHKYAHPYESV